MLQKKIAADISKQNSFRLTALPNSIGLWGSPYLEIMWVWGSLSSRIQIVRFSNTQTSPLLTKLLLLDLAIDMKDAWGTFIFSRRVRSFWFFENHVLCVLGVEDVFHSFHFDDEIETLWPLTSGVSCWRCTSWCWQLLQWQNKCIYQLISLFNSKIQNYSSTVPRTNSSIYRQVNSGDFKTKHFMIRR